MSSFPTLSNEDKLVFIAALRGQIAHLKNKIEFGVYNEGEDINTVNNSIVKARLTIKQLREELNLE